MKVSYTFRIILSVLGIGGLWLLQHQLTRKKPLDHPSFISTTTAPEPVLQRLNPMNRPLTHKSAPEAIAVIRTAQPQPVVKAAPAARSSEEQRRVAIDRYYDQMERNFSRQLKQLDKETDPVRRAKLIETLGRYVRIDTLEALEWATGLEDREEQRAALEAINKNALTGIGARIEMDDYGLPKIKNTTILSAAESTGQIQSGDYIAGMVTADGASVSFRGMTMQQIVNHLRGQPGTQIQLKMERSPEYGSTQPIPFEVPLERSLIVMQRPTEY
ncbi:hypothetical protein P4B35_12965 [Pontiellaceae bacterium B12227]|nr:hypothetical protein [Pontiellaceae bacterium B12227]